LRGAILRLDPSFGSGRLLAVAVIVGIVGLLGAVLAGRRGDEAMGFSMCAITGLLVSPVSWTHHWTLAVPALLLLGLRVHRNRSKTGLIAVGAILLVGYSYLPKLMAKPAFSLGRGLPVGLTLASASYVLIGCAALMTACAHEARMLAVGRVRKHQTCQRSALPAPTRGAATPAISPYTGVTRT
jgi:alpha-1,2-mannosyltransferase